MEMTFRHPNGWWATIYGSRSMSIHGPNGEYMHTDHCGLSTLEEMAKLLEMMPDFRLGLDDYFVCKNCEESGTADRDGCEQDGKVYCWCYHVYKDEDGYCDEWREKDE